MRITRPELKKELRATLFLLAPMIVSGFIEAAPGFINNAMLAHLGADKLAAGALVSMLFATIQVFFYGIFTTVSTLISHHYGAKETGQIGRVVRDALIFSFFLSIPLMVFTWHAEFLLRWLGQPSDTIYLANQYLHGLTFSIIPDFASMVLWHFFIGLGKPKVTLVGTLFYVPVNIFVGYCLIFGAFGFPRLEMWGVGLGNAVAFWVIFLGLFFYILMTPQYRAYFQWSNLKNRDYRLKELITVGLPVGFMWTIELFFGLIMAAFMGRIGVVTLAAHQISMQTLIFLFVIIASIAQVMTVRIGHSMGAKEYEHFPAIAASGLILVTIYTLCASSFCYFFPYLIIGLDFNLHNPANFQVIHLAVPFITAMALTQVFDGLRFTFFGILRGFKDTYFPFFVSLFCFFGVAVPTGYVALFYLHWPAVSFWYCTMGAIILATIIQALRFKHINRNYND